MSICLTFETDVPVGSVPFPLLQQLKEKGTNINRKEEHIKALTPLDRMDGLMVDDSLCQAHTFPDKNKVGNTHGGVALEWNEFVENNYHGDSFDLKDGKREKGLTNASPSDSSHTNLRTTRQIPKPASRENNVIAQPP